MNRRDRLLVAATLVVLVLASCESAPAREPLYEAVEECVEDQHDSVTELAEGTIGVRLSNVVPVDHPDAGDHLVVTEAYCVQDELGAPVEAHIPHPSDITVRFAAEWRSDGYRYTVAATQSGPDDPLVFDILFYQGAGQS